MDILFYLVFVSLFLGMVGWGIAKVRRRNPWLAVLIGLGCGVVVFLPFRAYRIAALDSALQQALISDAICTTEEIVIPGFPRAYNPSLLAVEDGYLLSFRVKSFNLPTYIKKLGNVRTSYIGLVKLDRDWKVCGEPYLLDLRSYDSAQISSSAQDARLFQFNDKILLFFNDYGATRNRSSYALYMTELVEKGGKFQAERLAKLLNYEKRISIEKNWSPFSVDQNLYLIYSGVPHLILKTDIETGRCQPIATTKTDPLWKWGEIRGGTPAYPMQGEMLTFFHSCQEVAADSFFGKKRGRNYVMGAYLFEKSYPFALKKITPPLGSLEDYTVGNRRKVIFPGGAAADGSRIHVVWGKNDSSIYRTTFDQDKLLASMVPVAQ